MINLAYACVCVRYCRLFTRVGGTRTCLGPRVTSRVGNGGTRPKPPREHDFRCGGCHLCKFSEDARSEKYGRWSSVEIERQLHEGGPVLLACYVINLVHTAEDEVGKREGSGIGVVLGVGDVISKSLAAHRL